jgi:hypothetical protein
MSLVAIDQPSVHVIGGSGESIMEPATMSLVTSSSGGVNASINEG